MPRTALALALALVAVQARAAAGDEASRSYRIETAGSTRSARVGEKGKLVLSIEPTVAKVHVNAEAPLKIRIDAPAGLKPEKAELGHADAVDPRTEGARFEVPFVATAKGRHEVAATLDFFICSDAWCVKQVKKVVIPVDVR